MLLTLNKVRLVVGLLLLLLAAGLFWFFFLRNAEVQKLIEDGSVVVDRIEAYQQKQGHLPSDLTEVGIIESETGPFFYKRRGENEYLVFFSLSPDQTWGYYSDSDQWEEGYR